ncbi:MAG: class I SAM-dependent rRNA methyltransferase [Pseudoflavonifractor sp.]|nr:class I SAM-dependent rRNA methyltransferase [Alloprevotella sp.]MCM1116806.1 class I SAM-dependent rRNA methyltransferase [Pseudoflavonifractor sp.]
MSKLPTIRLRRGKEESLQRFHPWVFSGALADPVEGLEEGEAVAVASSDGRLLGVGHYQIGSIAVRILAMGPEAREIEEQGRIGESYYQRRLSEALRLRQTLGLIRADNTAYRLVHGEGDFLPGLIVDVYGDTAVVQAHSVGMHFDRNIIADALTSLPDLAISNVYYKSETTLPFKARLDPVNDYILGGYSGNEAMENGLRFHIDWLRGQKTGFFVDQRDNRSLLERYSRGRRVLNMFCYTGGFSVYAMRGGAERVVSVDSSAKAIALTEANVGLNFPEDSRHEAVAVDAFRYLADMPTGAFDLIILDPPAFAKHRGAIRNALRGYQRLNAAGIEKAAKGSVIFTFSCSQAITKEQFRLAVFSAAAQTGRRVRILHQLTQPADHPVNIYHPEGEYLKGLVLYVE